MSKKYTNNEWLKKATMRWGNTFDLSRVNYKSSRSKVTIGCPEHSWVEVYPDHFLKKENKWGCPKCGREKGTHAQRITFEIFKLKANKLFENRYQYDQKSWKGIRESIKFKCPVHGWITQSRAETHLITNTGCPKCSEEIKANKRRINLKEFIKRASEKHGNKFNYENCKITTRTVNRKGQKKATIATDILCLVNRHHGFFEQEVSYHLNEMHGKGCPKCAGVGRTTELFISEANDIHNFKYSYEKVTYTYSEGSVLITCPIHGDFKQQAIAHLRGQGCPKCGDLEKGFYGLSNFKTDKEKAERPFEIYLVEILDYLKIGISKNLTKREHKYERIEHFHRQSTLGNCWCVEQYLLAQTEFAKPKQLPIEFDDWDGKEELRRTDQLDIVNLCNQLDEELNLCETIGWEEYSKKRIIYEKGYIIQKLREKDLNSQDK